MRTARIVAAFALVVGPAAAQEPSAAAPLRWDRAEGRHVALRRGGEELWRFHHDAAAPHPFFHPLALPGTGALTVDAPADHVWHHGLWFSWKYIDGVNYWEHAPGADRPAGRTRHRLVATDLGDDGAATFRLQVAYAPDDDAEPVLTEERTIRVSPPRADGAYAIDWTGAFTARAERVVLDRTPLPGEEGGKVFGGYAGLSLRLANLDQRQAITPGGPVEFNDQHRARTRADAFEYAGELDGRPVGVAVLAHPDNRNAPSPWYAIRSPAMTFFTPAVICYGPLELQRGERLTLRYRVVVHPGRWDDARLTEELAAFVADADPEVVLRERSDGTLAVEFGGREAFCYQGGTEFAIPHVYPLRAPSGRSLLVQHPDPFPHHRALWIADRVQLAGGRDVDFYHEWKNLTDLARPEAGHASAIRHDGFDALRTGAGSASFVARATWVVDTDQPVLRDERHFDVRALGDGEYLIDLRWRLTAAFGAVTFRSDAVHYAWPFLRMDPAYSVDGGGEMVDDQGRRGQAGTHGQVARWIDVSNTVDGATEGVAVFVFPDGEDHAWLTRDYGTFGPRRAAKWSGTGFTLPEGESIDGRVGILVHRGDVRGGRVTERYARYAEGRYAGAQPAEGR